MKHLLVCTIVRNQVLNLRRWHEQFARLIKEVKDEYRVTVSVYENDSTDQSGRWVEHWCQVLESSDGAEKAYRTYETLGTQQYGSVWNVDRLHNLAAARQRCLDQVGDLRPYNKIAWIEPDVTYDPHWCRELILARHPAAAGFEPDIYSGWSLRTEGNPKESVFLYDVCATRMTADEVCWDITERNGTWRGKTVVPTDLGGVDAMCLHPVWSTFSCFCVYNAEPFKRGVKWGYVNHRLSTGQQWIEDGDYGSGWLDADSAVMCEDFRARGYDKVYLNTNCLTRHL